MLEQLMALLNQGGGGQMPPQGMPPQGGGGANPIMQIISQMMAGQGGGGQPMPQQMPPQVNQPVQDQGEMDDEAMLDQVSKNIQGGAGIDATALEEAIGNNDENTIEELVAGAKTEDLLALPNSIRSYLQENGYLGHMTVTDEDNPDNADPTDTESYEDD